MWRAHLDSSARAIDLPLVDPQTEKETDNGRVIATGKTHCALSVFSIDTFQMASRCSGRLQETYKTPAIAVRDMLLQDGAIVTVYDPKVEKEDAFSETREHDIQVD